MVIKKFYNCDKCGKEVEKFYSNFEIEFSIRADPFLEAKADLCKDCYREFTGQLGLTRRSFWGFMKGWKNEQGFE